MATQVSDVRLVGNEPASSYSEGHFLSDHFGLCFAVKVHGDLCLTRD